MRLLKINLLIVTIQSNLYTRTLPCTDNSKTKNSLNPTHSRPQSLSFFWSRGRQSFSHNLYLYNTEIFRPIQHIVYHDSLLSQPCSQGFFPPIFKGKALRTRLHVICSMQLFLHNIIEKFTAWRVNSMLNFTWKTDIALIARWVRYRFFKWNLTRNSLVRQWIFLNRIA